VGALLLLCLGDFALECPSRLHPTVAGRARR